MSLLSKLSWTALGACALILSLAPAAAQVPREPHSPLDALVYVDPHLRPAPSGAVSFESAAGELPAEVRDGWSDFLALSEGPWKGYVDRRTGRIDFAEGAGIPFGEGAMDLAALKEVALSFLPGVAPMLGVDPASLELAPARSGQIDAHLALVDFDVRVDGIPVEGARVVFRINNGNLVQIGTEGLPSPGAQAPPELVERKEALALLAGYLGGFSAADTFLEGGKVRLLPVAPFDTAEPGQGRVLVRVWEFLFRRRGSPGTWRARVDATLGKLLELRDVNDYATVDGGVYPSSYIFANETVRPMPFANLSSGGFTNSAGQYTHGGGTVTSTLDGQYVRISDTCGPISQSSGANGHLHLGTSAGTDCATPGSGGGGNTHASRTQFYLVNRAKEVGRGWLPANGWLSGQLDTNVNIPDICNAYWDGSSINFFSSSSTCGNTGEIAGVSLHEYGHGLDAFDGVPSPDKGSGEAYADITAALFLHNSCMGPGFYKNGNCSGNGDTCTACSGVRDIDWAKHVSNTPHTVENFTRLRCSYDTGYDGPCGAQGHCESHVISEAVWDLAARDLPSPGSAAAWMTAERLWYLSRPTAGAAFTCNTGSIPWTSNGCSAGSLWRVLRAADDDDGNLANGTPNSCRIFAALNRHGIACAADAGANVCFSGCTPPAVPTVQAVAGNHQVAVSWTSSGPGVVYDVFRSESGCDAGLVKIANDLAGTALTDTGLANGLTYSYRVVAQPTGNGACAAPPSACKLATPQLPPCTSPPPAPTGVTATVLGVDRISVSWNAVPGAVSYEILRAPAPGGPWASVASATPPATSHLDLKLNPGTTYYYRVRASTAENCISVDSATASATTVDCQEVTLYANNFESGTGLSDWTVGSLDTSSTADWRGIQACMAHSGSKIFRFGGETCDEYYNDGVNIFARPRGASGIAVPAGAVRARASFQHRWNFETSWDGGVLSLSLNGTNYVGVPASSLDGAAYNGSLIGSCHPAGTNGIAIFTGFQDDFVETQVDLDAVCDLASGSPGGCGGRTLWLDFAALTDCIISYSGWFLDDVTVTACEPRGCTGPPALGTATTPADNQVLLTWSNGTPASTSFNVYRARGTCAAPGPFTRIAAGVTASSYLDSPVSGGAPHAYRVAGLDVTGTCESHLSTCLDVVPTGPCMLAPTFAGLAAAGDPALGTCSVGLSWSPATAHCSGAAATYDVFRSTSPDFVPSAANRVATGLTGTSWSDSGTLQYGTPYFYVVRARDSVSGLVDGNTVRRGAIPTGPLIMPASLAETFEAADGFDRDGWTHTGYGSDWTWSNALFHTPGHSWHAPGSSFASDRTLTSPPVLVGADTVLSFWHSYEFEECFDGGILEISSDGVKWAPVLDSAFLAGGYNGEIYGTDNPIRGRRAWCQGTLGSMTQVRVNLAAWSGKTVRMRWHAGDDFSVASPGWYVDSVTFESARVTNGCVTEPPPPLDFHTVAPCRVLDTRTANQPALQPGQVRSFLLAGSCGIPATARAVAVNMTVLNPGAVGNLSLFRADQVPPSSSSINFAPGVTRANSALIPLSTSGAIGVKANTSAPVHFLLDVSGYFQE